MESLHEDEASRLHPIFLPAGPGAGNTRTGMWAGRGAAWDDGSLRGRERDVDAERPGVDLEVLDEIQRRVLWLPTRIVDAANRERRTGDGGQGRRAPGQQRVARHRLTAL